MNHRLIMRELVEQHTKAITPPARKNGVQALANEWRNGAAPRRCVEFPREFELADERREESRRGRWEIACALYTIEISIDPASKEERALFLRAAEKFPPLATFRREVHWPRLREELGFTIELTFRTMALGHHFGVWVMETPLLGYSGKEAVRFAMDGMVLVRPVSRDHESMKLRLFARR